MVSPDPPFDSMRAGKPTASDALGIRPPTNQTILLIPRRRSGPTAADQQRLRSESSHEVTGFLRWCSSPPGHRDERGREDARTRSERSSWQPLLVAFRTLRNGFLTM